MTSALKSSDTPTIALSEAAQRSLGAQVDAYQIWKDYSGEAGAAAAAAAGTPPPGMYVEPATAVQRTFGLEALQADRNTAQTSILADKQRMADGPTTDGTDTLIDPATYITPAARLQAYMSSAAAISRRYKIPMEDVDKSYAHLGSVDPASYDGFAEAGRALNATIIASQEATGQRVWQPLDFFMQDFSSAASRVLSCAGDVCARITPWNTYFLLDFTDIYGRRLSQRTNFVVNVTDSSAGLSESTGIVLPSIGVDIHNEDLEGYLLRAESSYEIRDATGHHIRAIQFPSSTAYTMPLE